MEKDRERRARRKNGKETRIEGKIIRIGFVLLVILVGVFISTYLRQAEDRRSGNIADPLARIDSLSELDDKTREAAELFLSLAEEAGLEVKVTETYRTQERQDYLYEQGRTRPGQIVTWTRNSKHTKRNAFDIAKNVPGEEYSDLDFFRRAAEIGESIGLEAGYYWTDGKQDMPHFQMNLFSKVKYPEGYEQ